MWTLAQLPIDELKAQLGNGVILMILGMAIVFIFLTILVFTTKSVSKIVRKFEAKAPKAAPTAEVAMAAPASDAEVAAAIVAAVVKSRN